MSDDRLKQVRETAIVYAPILRRSFGEERADG